MPNTHTKKNTRNLSCAGHLQHKAGHFLEFGWHNHWNSTGDFFFETGMNCKILLVLGWDLNPCPFVNIGIFYNLFCACQSYACFQSLLSSYDCQSFLFLDDNASMKSSTIFFCPLQLFHLFFCIDPCGLSFGIDLYNLVLRWYSRGQHLFMSSNMEKSSWCPTRNLSYTD